MSAVGVHGHGMLFSVVLLTLNVSCDIKMERIKKLSSDDIHYKNINLQLILLYHAHLIQFSIYH